VSRTPRRVFISTAYEDANQARGFNLLSKNPYVDVEFVGRHLLTPVDSENPDYIKSKIREQMNGTSVNVVLIGQKTLDSDWVRWETEEGVAKGNGVLGIRLKGQDDAPIPPVLKEVGAKVINWNPDVFADEIERSALKANRPELGPAPARSVSGSGCN
jgi:antiphage defense system Thoeris ThsB-like protein